MGTILITGTSGFIGKALAADLAADHDIVCMSRKPCGLDVPEVVGVFSDFEDLRKLDQYPIDAVVHLAAVTGGCREGDGIAVNVEGTRRLMRYLMDRGCRKFVMASSIAAVGFQHVAFRPLALPMPDEHPCLDRDGYGLSKFLMEEVTRYYQRQQPQLDVINLRLASIFPDERAIPLLEPGPAFEWCCGAMTLMALSDAVRAFRLAAEAPYQPGVRILNCASPKAWVEGTTKAVLQAWYPDLTIDLSHYDRPGHAQDGVFDVRRIREELGFEAMVLPPITV
jgi:nucleoside-diphosphate-sugar epimerase